MKPNIYVNEPVGSISKIDSCEVSKNYESESEHVCQKWFGADGGTYSQLACITEIAFSVCKHSRNMARKRFYSLSRFHTGRPCVNGSLSRFHTGGLCEWFPDQVPYREAMCEWFGGGGGSDDL